MSKKDIVIFLSDQHTPVLSSYMGGPARTPNMEAMAERGLSADAAYTPCPLCVPARMALLSGQLPSGTGILSNTDTLPSTFPTFAHALAAEGYETVLIGRMHFVGVDQRHGFQHRLVGDTTPVGYNRPMERLRRIRGVFAGTFSEPNCTAVIGGGDSPVLEYDKQVVAAAVDWLSRPHEKPQLIVVGTYGPHFPYVASPERYRYYRERVTVPAFLSELPDYLDPPLRARAEGNPADEETALRAMAAYCGMIEETDEHLGTLRAAFADWRARAGREGVFIYTSDHGDQCGERRLYGKMTFFEKSARVPLLFEGDGIPSGARIAAPVSLLDLGPTVCALAGAEPPPAQDGRDILAPLDGTVPVFSEAFGTAGEARPGDDSGTLTRMVRQGRYKYITRHGYEEYDLLFDLEADPGETTNLAAALPEVVCALRGHLAALPTPEDVKAGQRVRTAQYRLMQRAEAAGDPPERDELWENNPERARQMPSEQA